MRIQEEWDPKFPRLLWWLGNLLAIDSDLTRSVGVAWLFKVDGRWVWRPRFTGDTSLFYNGVLFFRVAFPGFWALAPLLWALQYAAWGWFVPFGLFLHIRWSPRSDRRAFLQTGVGWKTNGRPGLLFCVSSDTSALKGTTGPNYGQAWGFDYGTH